MTAASRVTTATAPETQHMIRFTTSVTSAALPPTVYAVLADVRTHLHWAGTEAPDKNFRLLTVAGPDGVATVGTEFSSTGANGKADTFHDRSVVSEASAPRVFAFGTESRLERKHGKTWHTHFEHRYELQPAAEGTRITYTCDVQRGSYRPYWLHPMARPMTRFMVSRMMTKNLKNLARSAEQQTDAARGSDE
ncbi:MAG: SRPBCC family protein [Actinomycetes bacterium]